MFYWATVLTFILAIMISMLYPRPDRVKIEELPISESYISSFLVQHQVARDYLDSISFILPYMSQSSGLDVGSGSQDEKNIHVLKDNFNWNIMPTILPEDGFNGISYNLYPDGTKKRYETADEAYGFTSAVACLSRIDKNKGDTWEYGNIINCQDEAQKGAASFKYLITYGLLFQDLDIPSDKNLYREHAPDQLLWEKALFSRSKGSPDCGYIQLGSNDASLENNQAYIFNLNGKSRKIPYKLYQLYKNYLNGNNSNQPIFCITPINTPYILNGLIHHYDASMNNFTDSEPTHIDTKTTWTNIVTQNNISVTTTETDSPVWNSEGGTYLMMRGKDYLSIPVKGTFATTSLEDTFTLSFVIRFKNVNSDTGLATTDNNPLLGSDSFNYFPSIKAIYNSNMLTVRVLKNASDDFGQIKANIPVNTINQVTYVLGPTFHHLYVNGVLQNSATQTFENDTFPGLEINNLLIGKDYSLGTQLTADMFNIKIYNRALTEPEILFNLKSDKRRFGF